MRKQEGTICINITNKNVCIKSIIEANASSHKEKIGKGKDTSNIVFQWKIQLSNDWLQDGKLQDIEVRLKVS